jgi:diacylglycerol kinase (ATP)
VPQIALVANPRSGKGDTPGDVESELRRAGADVVRFDIEDAEAAAASGADRVVVAGGDGSIGLVAACAARAGKPLGVVPVGTANDFARAIGIPLDLSEACRLAANGTAGRRIDLARIHGRPFVNVASAGLAVKAARGAAGLKKLLGPGAYAVGALRAGVSAEPVECEVSCDGERVFSGRAWQVIVANTGAFGGGAGIAAADPADGLLDVTVVEAGPRLALIKRGYAMRAGTLLSEDGVRHARGRRIEVEGPTRFNVDGELCRDPGEFRVEPGAVEVVAP